MQRQAAKTNIHHIGPFTYDETSRTIRYKRKRRELTHQCAALLKELLLRKGEVVSREALYEAVSKAGFGNPIPKIIDVRIAHVRALLDELVQKGGDHIVTTYGEGYCISDTPVPRKNSMKCSRSRTGITKRLEHIHISRLP